MAVSHVGNNTAANLGLSGATSTTLTLPTHTTGDLLIIVALGTPDITAGTPAFTIGTTAAVDWLFWRAEIANVDTLDTDLYLGMWWKVAEASEPDPSVAWSSGFTVSSSSISNSRLSLMASAFRGQLGVPQSATGAAQTVPTSPHTPAGIILARNSAAVTLEAQRFTTAPSIATANGWTSHATVTSGGLARSLNMALKAGQPAGTVLMPTFTVSTLSTSALASITFDIPEVPVVYGAPGIYVDGAVHIA